MFEIDINKLSENPILLLDINFENLFRVSQQSMENFHFNAASRRFMMLRDLIPALGKIADKQNIVKISSLDDLVPVLFPHTVYKSYPLSYLEKGKIINFTSSTTLAGTPFLLHYVSSKGAVTSMTRALASELGAYGIRVNALAPGLTDTAASQGVSEQYPQILEATVQAQAIKETMQPEDIVGTVLYLASSWSDSVTGQLVVLDRGMMKH